MFTNTPSRGLTTLLECFLLQMGHMGSLILQQALRKAISDFLRKLTAGEHPLLDVVALRRTWLLMPFVSVLCGVYRL